jgi:glycosyltransferase A (GT-A) superfamily protein (DUF2064 family)
MEKLIIASKWLSPVLRAHRVATAFGRCKAKQLHEKLYTPTLDWDAAKRAETFGGFETRFRELH